MTHQHQHHTRRRGFTLVELGVVLAIIGILASIAVPSVSYFLRQGRVKNVTGSINSIRNWVGSLQASGSVGGALPITEGARPPSVGAALLAQAPETVAQAARLDQILVSAGITDKLLTFGMGNQTEAAMGTGPDLMWSAARRAFYAGGVREAISATATATRDWSACSRLESTLASPSLAPSAAQGGNFRLDGVRDVTPNTVISYVVLKGVPYKDAVELAKALDGENLLEATEDSPGAQESGPVVFAAPSAGDATVDVYVYVAAL